MIKDSQHTFRHRRSRLANLLDIFEDNAAVADKKSMTDAVLRLDFSNKVLTSSSIRGD